MMSRHFFHFAGWFVLAIAIAFTRVTFAVHPDQCVAMYADHARSLRSLANTSGLGGRLLQLGATTAGSSSTIGHGLSTVGTLGGSSLGTTADQAAVTAQFAANVAQAVAESQGRVTGPFTVRLASDLNAAIYGSGRFGRWTNPLSSATRRDLRSALGERRVSAEDLRGATAELIASGALCDARGDVLSQEAWAVVVVGRITGARTE